MVSWNYFEVPGAKPQRGRRMVAQQTRHVGIRIGLGATPTSVLRLIVGGCLRFTAVGLIGGTLAALGLTRLLTSLIYDVTATDPLTFGSVLTAMVFVALLGGGLPARRAARVDPLAALRAE